VVNRRLAIAFISQIASYEASPKKRMMAMPTPTPQSNNDLNTSQARYRRGLISMIHDRLATLGISLLGREYVMRALQDPSRSVESSTKSMSGAYPSVKMGVTIGFESRTIEYAMVLQLEHDSDVVAYLDQPPKIKIIHRSRGRVRGFMQTPDFLVIRNGGIVLIECKRLAQVLERIAIAPDYFVNERGRWICPPAQQAAAEYGFTHEVWTEPDFNANRLRNLQLMEDYLLPQTSTILNYEQARLKLQESLHSHAKMSILDLLKNLSEWVTVDHIYLAIARGDVACEFDRQFIADHTCCYVYRDASALQAYDAADFHGHKGSGLMPAPTLLVALGSKFEWDGVTWEICNLGNTQVTLTSGGRVLELPQPEFQRMAEQGRFVDITSTTSPSLEDPEVRKLLDAATPSELAGAVEKLHRILPSLGAGAPASRSRTARRYIASYRAAEAALGNGFVGLLPKFSQSGNRKPRLAPEVLEIVETRINHSYENPINKHIKHVHGLIAADCDRRGLPAPSYAWFCKQISQLPAFRRKLKREGSRAAYGLEERQPSATDFLSSRPDRAWASAHIDHTLIDVETIYGPDSAPLGRAWLTVIIDHFSLRVLGFFLTFDPPSNRSVLMAFRDCVRRYGRLPDLIVVDGGKEFRSTWFSVVCARYRVTIFRRPPAKARFGSQVERHFGTINSNFLHTLRGNTQLRKNVRQMTDAVDPDVFAVWTLPELYRALERYLFETYDQLVGRGLLDSPRAVFLNSIAKHGSRSHRVIPYDQSFVINTCPTTPKGSARVQPDGVKINYLYYNAPALQRMLGTNVPVRYEPMDVNVAYAQVDGKWERLKTRHEAVLSNRTEREIALASAEWRKRRSQVEKGRLVDKALVTFLIEMEQTETLLLERRRANEMRRILANQMDEEPALFEGAEAPQSERVAATQTPAVAPEPVTGPEGFPLEFNALQTY
jgi:putative transposase